MPEAPDPITAAPALPWQPWDATGENPAGRWVTVDGNSGPANNQGRATGEFESGPDQWQQT